MTGTVFKISRRTGREIDELSPTYTVRDRSEMPRKALALLRVAARYMDQDGFLTIKQPNGTILKLDMIF